MFWPLHLLYISQMTTNIQYSYLEKLISNLCNKKSNFMIHPHPMICLIFFKTLTLLLSLSLYLSIYLLYISQMTTNIQYSYLEKLVSNLCNKKSNFMIIQPFASFFLDSYFVALSLSLLIYYVLASISLPINLVPNLYN